MVLHNLIFAGKQSKDYGLFISGGGTYNAPERDVTTISIPGRNGDMVLDNGRWSNISVSYPAFIVHSFRKNAEAVRAWIAGAIGYQRLEDDYHPDFYRLARYSGNIDWDMAALNIAGQTTLTFDCKPQRFLKLGERPIEISQATTITNQWQTSLPLITIWGSGAASFTINSNTIQISSIPTNIVLDCDVQSAYSLSGLNNLNDLITLPSSGDFLSFATGENQISFTGNITKIEIVPRWWTL